MKRCALPLALLLTLAAPASAGFDEGLAAVERGDYATAYRELLPLAEQGNASAQFNLGLMYRHGEGVAQDYAQAGEWYRLAAASLPPGEDRDRAARMRDIVAAKMTPEQIARVQELARNFHPKLAAPGR